MKGVDVVFLVVVLAPLFVAKWRVSLVGLAAQGFLLWYAAGGMTMPIGAPFVFDLLDFLAFRAILAPALLYVSFRRPGVPAHNDLIPPNLIAWMVVVLLVLVSFRFAGLMEPEGLGRDRVAVAATSLALGFFVLSTQSTVLSQIIGAMRIENAVALFEIGTGGEHVEPVSRTLQVLVTAGAIGLYAAFLQAMAEAPDETPEDLS